MIWTFGGLPKEHFMTMPLLRLDTRVKPTYDAEDIRGSAIA
jgi:hypothetical protein